MLKNKKGIELSLNMIIITVIGLLVLMVMIFFVVKNVRSSNDATACINNDGKCVATGTSCTGEYSMPSPLSCPKENRCCVKGIFGEDNTNAP